MEILTEGKEENRQTHRERGIERQTRKEKNERLTDGQRRRVKKREMDGEAHTQREREGIGRQTEYKREERQRQKTNRNGCWNKERRNRMPAREEN